MGIWSRMEEYAEEGNHARVVVVGAGFIGSGLVHRLVRTPGMGPALVVNRTPERGVEAYERAGRLRSDVVVSDDPEQLSIAVAESRPAVTADPTAVASVAGIDLIVEATGAMDHGARVMLQAMAAGRDVVSMNAEVDATIGHLLHHAAREHGVRYTIADGDQPGVLLRQIEHVVDMGFEIVAAVNCKRNLDVHQNPDDSRPYAKRDGTSVLMTTAFGDGTKMQIENAVVANVTGLVPDQRGMHGVETTVAMAAVDVPAVLQRRGVVDFTRGGDFGGGVGVIGAADDPAVVQPYMRYAKMGEGPAYFFFRPYHLLQFELPRTIAELVLDGRVLGVPPGDPVAEVVAVAKRDLEADEPLDGIGGYACYGQIDTVDRAGGLLPIGLAEYACMTGPVARDQPIPLDAVELDEDALLVQLRREQDELVASAGAGA
jgi:predicted homoserine dehydrogenase-like protein